MKKIKFMMPALAIASTAAAITPMVTSCNKGVGAEWTAMTKNKLKEFKPDIEPLKAKKYDKQFDSYVDWANAMVANPKALANDILYGWYEYFNSLEPAVIGVFESLNISISNLIINKQFNWTWRYWEESTSTYRYERSVGILVDLTINFDGKNFPMILDSEEIKVDKQSSLTLTNLPFDAWWANDDKLWVENWLGWDESFSLSKPTIAYREKTINRKDQSIVSDLNVFADTSDGIYEILTEVVDGYLYELLYQSGDDYKSYYFQNASMKS